MYQNFQFNLKYSDLFVIIKYFTLQETTLKDKFEIFMIFLTFYLIRNHMLRHHHEININTTD